MLQPEEFKNLAESEKSFWYDIAARIPEKLKKLNLFIRPFEDFCRTCIITDKEIASLVQADLERYCRELALSGPSIGKQKQRRGKAQSQDADQLKP